MSQRKVLGIINSNSFLGQSITKFRRNKLAVFSLFVVSSLIIISFLAPLIALDDPVKPHPENSLLPGFWTGNFANPFGTDELGRDIFSRLVYGSQISLQVGFTVIIITAIFGIALGLISAYYGGIIDTILMRVTDIFLSFPPLLLALVVVAILGTGLQNAMLAIALVYIPQMGRIVRSSALTVKELDYVESGHAIGVKDFSIIVKHILPNILASTVVYLTLLLADAILYTAALGFLGIGIDPSTPEWGAMLSNGRDYIILGKWWVTVFPGLMIATAVFSFNLLGDGLREALDPKTDY